MRQWQNHLLMWYEENAREYPWRTTKDPYKIWLSEVILQQTRTQQGLPYYNRFITQFPTVTDLAKATEDEVLKLWQGLGYYSRARNLHETAQKIAFECAGVFPSTYEGLKTLKGVGDYTAAAIASICYGAEHAVVDGNVFRVLARHFGISIPIDSTSGFTHFKNTATSLIKGVPPATFNQAIMDFGAHHCTPKQPKCTSCPFQKSCVAYTTQTVHEYPVKAKKIKVQKRYFHFLVLQNAAQEIILEQRTQKGIWKQLYQFPLLERPNSTSPKVAVIQQEAERYAEVCGAPKRFNTTPILHKLSHQHLHLTFWLIPFEKSKVHSVAIEDLSAYAVPVPLENFIKKYF